MEEGREGSALDDGAALRKSWPAHWELWCKDGPLRSPTLSRNNSSSPAVLSRRLGAAWE